MRNMPRVPHDRAQASAHKKFALASISWWCAGRAAERDTPHRRDKKKHRAFKMIDVRNPQSEQRGGCCSGKCFGWTLLISVLGLVPVLYLSAPSWAPKDGPVADVVNNMPQPDLTALGLNMKPTPPSPPLPSPPKPLCNCACGSSGQCGAACTSCDCDGCEATFLPPSPPLPSPPKKLCNCACGSSGQCGAACSSCDCDGCA